MTRLHDPLNQPDERADRRVIVPRGDRLSARHMVNPTFAGLDTLVRGGRPEGRLYFVNVQQVGEAIRALIEQHKPRVVALDMSRVPDIEYSALQLLIEREKRASEQAPALWLAGLNPGVLEVVRRSGLADRLGSGRLLYNARAAIERFLAGEEKTVGKPG